MNTFEWVCSSISSTHNNTMQESETNIYPHLCDVSTPMHKTLTLVHEFSYFSFVYVNTHIVMHI
jgi:hypothetical protein